MWHHLLIACGGIVGLVALWLGVGRLAGRHAAGVAADGCDGPEPVACGSCSPERAGHCTMRLFESDTE